MRETAEYEKAKADLKRPVDVGCAIALVVGLVLVLVWQFRGGEDRPPSPPSESQVRAEVAVRCESAVEAQLLSPASADFPFGHGANVQELGANRYRLVSYVDAQNAFGAQVRTHFTCETTGPPGSMQAAAVLVSP